MRWVPWRSQTSHGRRFVHSYRLNAKPREMRLCLRRRTSGPAGVSHRPPYESGKTTSSYKRAFGYSFNLGYAFPTALGVKVAEPDRPVICMSGDGGFMFNASELSTAVTYGINVVDSRLQKRLLGERRPRPERHVRRNLRDRPAQPGLR